MLFRSQLAQPAQGFVGKVAIVALDGLQQDDRSLFAAPLFGYDLIDEGKIDGLWGWDQTCALPI